MSVKSLALQFTILYGLPLLFFPISTVAEAPVNFERDIRPILSDNCFHCHGPDEAERKAGIRLDTKEGLFASIDNGHVIAPGEPDNSLLIYRVYAVDPDEAMPPAESKKKFGDKERALLRRWVEEGAVWSEHWAFTPPIKPELPVVPQPDWVRNPIDHFTAAMMESKGLNPMQEASRETLIRRLSLDLTGLPPSPEEVNAFVNNTADDAYEQLVNRLLDSPHYGERMAWPWLDAARYSDTNGYQGDRTRTMYPWRDWVIEAFNENMPYDKFTLWQLAGDLLPEPTKEQKLATGFNRNHMINGEGGRIAEENRVEYVFDQIETVGTVWMGLTFNCCRCHDHKYDPLTNKDYYSFFAFFNQTQVSGAGGDPMTAPNMIVNDETVENLAAYQKEIDEYKDVLNSRTKILKHKQKSWEEKEREELASAESPWATITILNAQAKGQELTLQENGAILASGDNPASDNYELQATTKLQTISAIRLEALRHPDMTGGGLARSDSGNFVLTDFCLCFNILVLEFRTSLYSSISF